MSKVSIRLPKGEWEYDDEKPLGKEGGFGEVFLGYGDNAAVAVKRLKISAAEAAHRELSIAQRLMEQESTYIVPVLDAGQDANSDRYYLIMPVCECSLQDAIDKAKTGIDTETASKAVIAIIRGLIEVGDITHRDLKPDNILWHEGDWKIADFGIAKFVEDSTSMDTLRNCLTPAYAAPEQWKGERPSSATDVYALGCIIHTLFTGMPPFGGSLDDIRDGHLLKAPVLIDSLSPKIAAFVSHMLRKPPNARPAQERCAKVLQDIERDQVPESAAHSALALASREVAEKEAIKEAETQARDTIRLEREELYNDAVKELSRIKTRFFGYIKEQSESVITNPSGGVRLGAAELNISNAEHLDSVYIGVANDRNRAYQNSGLDVLGWAEITVACENGGYRTPYKWSASLLYMDRKDGSGFRWYEVAFWRSGRDERGKTTPFSLQGFDNDMYLAFGNAMHTINIAYGPCPIDSEDEQAFIDRWMGLVAKAALGNLTRPTALPIRDFC